MRSEGDARLVHRIREPVAAPEGLLVLLHGRGADEHDLFPLLDGIDPERKLLGVTPRGPLALPPQGAHWYVVRRVGYPDPQTFFSTFAVLQQWLEAFHKEAAIPMNKVVLGGFSQGAVMSYALALAKGRARPAALLAFSGFIPTVESFELDLAAARDLRVAIGHGSYDPVIGVEWGRDARARLEAAEAQVLYRESPMGHAIDPGFVRELRPWLDDALAASVPPQSG